MQLVWNGDIYIYMYVQGLEINRRFRRKTVVGEDDPMRKNKKLQHFRERLSRR